MTKIPGTIVFLIPFCFSPVWASHRLPAEELRTGESRWVGECRQAVSVATYDEKGNKLSFEGDRDYFSQECLGELRYGVSHRLEFRGGGRYRKNTDVDSSGQERGARGIESAGLALRYKTKSSIFQLLSLDVEVRRLFSNRITEFAYREGNKIALGDEGYSFRLSNGFVKKLGRRFLFVGGWGLALPGEGQSVESDFDMGLYWDRRAFAVGLGLYGVSSFKQDDFTDAPPGAKPPKHEGNTNTVNSINRSYYGTYGTLFLALTNSLSLKFRGGGILKGRYWDEQIFSEVELAYHKKEHRRQLEDQRITGSFKQYDIEAEVIKVSSDSGFVKIDKGATSGIDKGMRFDFYETDFRNKNILLASGVVFKVGVDTAIVKILRVFRSGMGPREGDIARGKRSLD